VHGEGAACAGVVEDVEAIVGHGDIVGFCGGRFMLGCGDAAEHCDDYLS
jgi:hypothetical protein